MTAPEVLARLEPLGSESTRRVLRNHGARDPLFGVKIADLKTLLKQTGRDNQLALDLYATGHYDAMVLAGLVADDGRFTRADLKRWVKAAYCPGLAEYTVAWVASMGRFSWVQGTEWLDAKAELTAAAGWSTLSNLVSITPDAGLELPALTGLLERVQKSIHAQPNRVRYTMNGFVMAVGSYVTALTPAALGTAAAVGPVSVDMGNTACEVPSAAAMIAKVKARGSLGKKRKSAKC